MHHRKYHGTERNSDIFRLIRHITNLICMTPKRS